MTMLITATEDIVALFRSGRMLQPTRHLLRYLYRIRQTQSDTVRLAVQRLPS